MIQFRIEIDFSSQRKIEKATPEFRQGLRDNVLALSHMKEPKTVTYKDGDEDRSYVDFDLPHEIIVSDVELEYLQSEGVDLQIKKFKQTYVATPTEDKGSQYHFHLPNLGLLEVRYVRVLDDACTEELQRMLNMGWKILAICPPNGARRPDYILGSNVELT